MEKNNEECVDTARKDKIFKCSFFFFLFYFIISQIFNSALVSGGGQEYNFGHMVGVGRWFDVQCEKITI